MEGCLLLGVSLILGRIAYLDYKYYYIADRDIALGILFSLALKFIQHRLTDGILGLLLGLASSGLVYIIAKKMYKKTALGSGDVTLSMFLGSVVGAGAYASWAVFFSLLFLVGLVPLHLTKKLDWNRAFPLAPFLNGATLMWLFLEHYGWSFRIS